MKLISSTPASPTRRSDPPSYKRGWFMRRLRSLLFSTRTAWWVFVVIVAAFAISVLHLMRAALEASLRAQ